MPNPPIPSIQETIQRSEEAIAFFDIVWRADPTEEEIREARIRLMIKKYS